MRKISQIAILLAALMSGLAPLAPAVAQDETPVYELTDCPFDVSGDSEVECGYVVVPEDHGNPGGPAIRLGVAVFKDQGDARLPDPMMLLCGGPGERCLANAPLLAQVFAPLHANRDLIVFDQRGVGLSEPALECPEFAQAMFDLLAEPDPNVAVRTRFDALVACRDRLVGEGHNLTAYTTTQNAADVDTIRAALGYEQVNLFGGSYGSLLAQAVMRDHPEGIRSVILLSVLPLEKSFFVDVPMVATDTIVQLLDACASDEACNNAYPNLHEVLFEVIDQLNDAPVPTTVTNPLDGQRYDAALTGEAVLSNLITFLYVTDILPVLPQAIYDLHNGDYALMTQLSSTRLALLDLTSRGMTFSVMCTEDLVGRTPDDLLDVLASVPQQLQGQADTEVTVEYSIFGICENWPVEEAEPWVKAPLISDIPTLVLAGEFDPVTPPTYARLVAGYLENSYYFEFPGVSHGFGAIANPCAQGIAAAFIDDPTTAPDGVCVAEMPGVMFDLPVEDVETIPLAPVTVEDYGISSVAPEGWEEVAPGYYVRQNTALDQTQFILDADRRNASGRYALTLEVAGADVVEVPLAPGAIEPGQTVEAMLEAGVVDEWRFSGQRGQVVTITVMVEDNAFDAFMFLLDSGGEVIAWDDDSGPDTNSVIESVTLPADDTYTIRVRKFGGDAWLTKLAADVGLPELPASAASVEIGSFTWTLYPFEVRGYPFDLALAEENGSTYFVLLVSMPDERETLYEQVFLPALEAVAPIE